MTNELAKKLNADTNNDSKKAVPGEEQATGENSNPFPSCLREARAWAYMHGITHDSMSRYALSFACMIHSLELLAHRRRWNRRDRAPLRRQRSRRQVSAGEPALNGAASRTRSLLSPQKLSPIICAAWLTCSFITRVGGAKGTPC